MADRYIAKSPPVKTRYRLFSGTIIKGMAFSKKAVSMLTALKYQPSAGWGVNIVPFGSIFWLDEMPSMAELFENDNDKFLIYSMFSLRLKLWDGQTLNPDDQQLWDSVKAQVPEWAFFKRLRLTRQQKQDREQAEMQVQHAFDPLNANEW